MTFQEVINDPFVYLVCGAALFIVVCILIVFLIMAWKKGLTLGYDNKRLLKVVRTTILVSVGPALSILIPLLALIRLLGAPWSWLRLSVVGSAPLELLVANFSLDSVGYDELGSVLPAEAFGVIVLAVGFSITSGMMLNMFLNRKLSHRFSEMKQKNHRKTEIFTMSLFGGFIAAVSADSITQSSMHLGVFITGAVSFFIILLLTLKTKSQRLKEFNFAIALVMTMVIAIVLNGILG